jgi:hypothetical protein
VSFGVAARLDSITHQVSPLISLATTTGAGPTCIPKAIEQFTAILKLVAQDGHAILKFFAQFSLLLQ